MTTVPGRPQARGFKQPQDTVVGCRSRAEADLQASVAMSTANERIRLETSAASWNARAEMLQRLEDTHEARKLALRTSAWREHEELPARI